MITCATFRAAIGLDDIDAVPPRDLAVHAAGCPACGALAPEMAVLGGGGPGAPSAADVLRPLPRVRIFFWRRAAAAVLIVGLVAVAGRFATAPAPPHADARPGSAPSAAAGLTLDPSHFRSVAAAPAVTQSTFADVIGGRVVRSQVTVTHWSAASPVRP